MIREMREKLSREIDQLSHELNVLLPQAIAQAVELGDLRENSEYKAALERPAVRAGAPGTVAPAAQPARPAREHRGSHRPGRARLPGHRLDLDSNDTDTYMVVLAEMMDIDAGHISLASPLGRALANGRVGDEISLRLPTTSDGSASPSSSRSIRPPNVGGPGRQADGLSAKATDGGR